MSELKAFTFGLGQYTENGSPCVVAFDGERNPRLASDEKFYLKSEADKVIAEKDQRIKELTPHWVRLSDELPTTYGPHLVIFQNGKGGCLSFNVETKSFQVEEPIQWWADAKYIFGDWTAEK